MNSPALALKALFALPLMFALLACESAPNEATARPADETNQATAAVAPPKTEVQKAVSRYDFPSCAELRAANQSQEALTEAFDKTFPAEIIGEDSVETLELNSEDLRTISAYLACVAQLTPDMPPSAAESGLALYASKRHGRAALAALDGLGTGTGPDAEAAKAFASQMRAHLKGPGE